MKNAIDASKIALVAVAVALLASNCPKALADAVPNPSPLTPGQGCGLALPQVSGSSFLATGSANGAKAPLNEADLVAEAVKMGRWDGITPLPGLTVDETGRFHALYLKGTKLPDPADKPVPCNIDTRVVIERLRPEEVAEWKALAEKQLRPRYDAAMAAYQRYGPIQVPKIAPSDREAWAKLNALYPGALWATSDAPDGTMTMSRPSPGSLELTGFETLGEALARLQR